MGKTMTRKRDLTKELLADVEQIEDNARLYRAGRNSAYQAVAIQLRNMMLGRRGLLARVVGQPTLHCFRPSNVPAHLLEAFQDRESNLEVAILDVRGSLKLSTAAPGAHVEIDFCDELLPVDDWLGQWTISPDVTLRRLIQEVADEEVAHTQDRFGETVARTQDFVLGGAANEREMRHMVIVALGEYVARRVHELMADLPESNR